MKKSTFGMLAAVAAVGLAGTASAQMGPTTPFSVEVRAGAALPTGDFGDVVSTGWTVGIDGTFNITPMFGIYGGYSYSSYALDEELEDLFGEADVTEQGFDAGVKATLGGGTLPFTPYLRGGLIFHKLGGEFEDEDVETEDSDYELGFEVGGGLMFPLGPRISVTPSVSYTSFSISEDEDEIDEFDVDISAFKIGIGLNIRI
jgi:hypothetical protein